MSSEYNPPRKKKGHYCCCDFYAATDPTFNVDPNPKNILFHVHSNDDALFKHCQTVLRCRYLLGPLNNHPPNFFASPLREFEYSVRGYDGTRLLTVISVISLPEIGRDNALNEKISRVSKMTF